MAKFVDAFTVDWSQFFFYAFPPFLSYFQVCAKNNSRPGNRNYDNPEVDNSAILYSCAGPSDRHTKSSEGFCSESGSSNSGRSLSTTSPTGVTGMQIIRQSLQKSEFLPDCRDHHAFLEIALTNNTKCISASGYNFLVKDHMIPCVLLWGPCYCSCMVSSRKAQVIRLWVQPIQQSVL